VVSMSATKHQPPSKIRYEKSHPLVACRVLRAEYDQLDEVRRSQGKSFREFLLTGAGLLAADGGRALSRVLIGKCHACHEPIVWDLTNPVHMKVLEDILERASCEHGDCLKKGRSP